MELAECIERMTAGETVVVGSELHRVMHEFSQDAARICAEINTGYPSPDEISALMAELTGRPAPEGFRLMPSFNSDFGKNIHLGKNVFINSGCKFQDQGGTFLGDRCLIGHNVVIATLNHHLDPGQRSSMIPQSVRVGNDAWIGSGAIILPGVSVGEGAVVAAGAVVTKDVAPRTVVAGNPAKPIKPSRIGDEI